MKNIILAFLILFIISCKSTKEVKNNQLDKETITSEKIDNTIKLSKIDLEESEITFLTADEKKPVIVTDTKGKTQTFKNVKSVTLKKKTEFKKDSAVSQKKEAQEKIKDNSIINEQVEIVSDFKNVKGIFGYIFLSLLILLIVFLIIRFRIKAK